MRIVALVLVGLSVLGTPSLGRAVADPAVEGPILGPGAPFVAGTTFDLAEIGYTREEFFIAGTASAYTSATALGSDGVWTVAPGATAPYKTRILVYRPIDPQAFKGTVLLEWLNVSGGLDSAPDWIAAHVEMVRSGMIWVGVSAQRVGVEGGSGGLVQAPLKLINPERYGTLSHPGDSFSYDMFSQAGQAVAGASGPSILGGNEPDRVIAVGESQSAFRLTTYVNAVHPLAGVFDGFLIHSRGGGGASLAQEPLDPIPAPTPLFIRTDLDVPVFTVQTETDLFILGSIVSRQPDTKRVRLWEIAGAAHADLYTLRVGMADRGDDPSVAAVEEVASPLPGIIDCVKPINAGPQHWVLNAAIAALERWVKRGKAPRQAPVLETTSSAMPAFVLDDLGNVRGGVRTPWVDVPVARLSGEGQTGGGFCRIFGTTALFDDQTLAALYATPKAYLKRHKRATKKAVRKGFLRKQDARLILDYAKSSGIGG